jgi:hypothetical protein
MCYVVFYCFVTGYVLSLKYDTGTTDLRAEAPTLYFNVQSMYALRTTKCLPDSHTRCEQVVAGGHQVLLGTVEALLGLCDLEAGSDT